MFSKPTANVIAASILGISIGVGLLLGGATLGKAIYLTKSLNRTVTVKGLAERDVKANLAVWEINYREIGGNLADLNTRLQHDQDVVIAFLKQHKFDGAEISILPVRLDDKMANTYQSQNTAQSPDQRYILSGGVGVRSAHVDQVRDVSQLSRDLLQQGVQLAADLSSLTPNPSYFFTQLDDIRPGMLADSTKSARLVAEQFANDSQSTLNGIQRANQGVFQITSRDASANGDGYQNATGTIEKRVRLVTTIDYRLR